MKKTIKIILVGLELLFFRLFLNNNEIKAAELDFSGYFNNLPALQKPPGFLEVISLIKIII